jgi:hypothetical protein
MIGNLEVIDLTSRLPHSYSHRDISRIADISVHHTVTNDPGPQASLDQEYAIIMAIQQYHLKEFLGYCYHMTTFSSGRCYLTGAWDTIRYVVGGQRNVTNLAIAMIGNFTVQPPIDQHLYATRSLIENTWMQLGQAPERPYPVYGHYEIAANPTACPGATKDAWLPYLKTGEGGPTAPPWPLEEAVPVDPILVQLGVLWNIAESLPENQQAQAKAAIIALKTHLGYE